MNRGALTVFGPLCAGVLFFLALVSAAFGHGGPYPTWMFIAAAVAAEFTAVAVLAAYVRPESTRMFAALFTAPMWLLAGYDIGDLSGLLIVLGIVAATFIVAAAATAAGRLFLTVRELGR